MMQMFNYFNCRKIGSKEINVLEGLDWHNALFFILTIASHCLLVQVAAESAQLYSYGLTIQQWLLSAALAIIVWIVGFLVRLLPDSSHLHRSKKLWRNKSYNLNVKLVGKNDKFYEFDRD
jgi:cyanate permease